MLVPIAKKDLVNLINMHKETEQEIGRAQDCIGQLQEENERQLQDNSRLQQESKEKDDKIHQLGQSLQKTGKIGVKILREDLPKICTKAGCTLVKLSLDAAKTWAKIAKGLPFVGLVLGVGLAIKNWRDGDKRRAIAELASGAISLAPGVGMPASLTIDAALLAHDALKIRNQADQKNVNTPPPIVEMAYGTLGITEAEPSQEAVDRCYKGRLLKIHSDKALSKENSDASEHVKELDVCKDAIYSFRGWSKK